MPASADTLIDVRALIDRPGATTSLDRRMPAPADLSDDLVRIGPHVTVEGIVESVVDGVLVRGALTAQVRLVCARCLTERDGEVRADVVELFSAPDHVGDAAAEAGYEIVDATIDLDTLQRDALAAAVPTRPLCRPDCAGLCPVCGADLNTAPCDGHPEQHDPRWSALADLQLTHARQTERPA
jgi:uncharacterized protein